MEPSKKKLFWVVPLATLIALIHLTYLAGLIDYFSLEDIRTRKEEIKAFVAGHFALASLLYLTIYSLSVALTVPWSIVITLLGGYLFPQPLSTLYVVIADTCGATLCFFLAQTAVGDLLRRKAGFAFRKIEKGIEKNGAYYLLFLRIVPIFPFWVVNIAPPLLGIRLKTFVWTTLFGIIPPSFVFTEAGAALHSLFERPGPITLSNFLTGDVKIALIGMCIFALFPILAKKRHWLDKWLKK